MAITLAEVKKQLQDDLAIGVIDEFRKSSWLFDNLVFHNAVSPTGGGATMTYSYLRVKTESSAAFRGINEEYAASHATKERHSVDLKIFGGSIEIDRVLARLGGAVDEVTFQMQQKIKAANALFCDTVINGDSGVDSKAFDGLDKALTGSSTEFKPSIIDLSTSDMVDKNHRVFTDQLDEFISSLDGVPTGLLMNSKMAAKVRAVARRNSMYTTDKNDLGVEVEFYGKTPFIDLGAKPGTSDPIVPIKGDGTTSIYAVRIGMDGFHGVSLADALALVNVNLPNLNGAGVIKKGDVEMVAAVALKATRAAGVIRNVKVQ